MQIWFGYFSDSSKRHRSISLYSIYSVYKVNSMFGWFIWFGQTTRERNTCIISKQSCLILVFRSSNIFSSKVPFLIVLFKCEVFVFFFSGFGFYGFRTKMSLWGTIVHKTRKRTVFWDFYDNDVFNGFFSLSLFLNRIVLNLDKNFDFLFSWCSAKFVKFYLLVLY